MLKCSFFFVCLLYNHYYCYNDKCHVLRQIVLKKKRIQEKKQVKSILLQTINFDSPRGGISLVTEKGVLTTSRLLVQKAIQSDSGVYTCDPSNANPTSVRVHILNGKSFKYIFISDLKCNLQ